MQTLYCRFHGFKSLRHLIPSKQTRKETCLLSCGKHQILPRWGQVVVLSPHPWPVCRVLFFDHRPSPPGTVCLHNRGRLNDKNNWPSGFPIYWMLLLWCWGLCNVTCPRYLNNDTLITSIVKIYMLPCDITYRINLTTVGVSLWTCSSG